MIREVIVQQFHIITRSSSSRPRSRAAAPLVVSVLVLAAAVPAAASPRLEDPGPTLWALSVAPEARAREVYLAAGGAPDSAGTANVRWLVGAAIRRLEPRGRSNARVAAGSLAPARPEVVLAILDAAARTGTPSSWLLRTARRESGLNPRAVSRSSTATGLFQFVEETWLRSLRLYGAMHGLAREAATISLASDGAVRIDAAHRARILALRTNPRLASLMAAELARANRQALTQSLARPVSDAELYVAHFLGAAGAVRLIRAAERTPTASAMSILPRAASANPTIFVQHGRALSAAQLLRRLKHA